MIKQILPLFFLLILANTMPLHASVTDGAMSGLDTAYFKYTDNGQQFAYLTVSILSPSTVTSLDFSIKINPANLSFDTLIVQVSYLDGSFAFYDSTDSTLRFSSFSLQNYQNQVALITVRFNKLNPLTTSDFNPIQAYINGESAVSALNMSATGISDEDREAGFVIYPNPAKGFVNIMSERTMEVTLIDIHGKKLANPRLISPNSVNTLELTGLKPGIYFLRANTNEYSISREIIITR